VADMDCLPDSLKGRSYYVPTQEGREKLLGQRAGDPMLVTLEGMLRDILDAHPAMPAPLQSFPGLIEKWRFRPLNRGPTLHRADFIGLGSKAISEHYPTDDRRTAAGSKHGMEDWTHFFDYMASVHMDHAGEKISATVGALVKKPDNAALMRELAQVLKRPMDPPIAENEDDARRRQREQLVQYGRIIVELIRVAHYLEIRPERRPGGRATEHHAGHDGMDWSTVFARYLDVPIQARKRSADANSKPLDGLVPTRSLRVDRFSQLYHVHASSQAKAHGNDTVRYPGHLAKDNFITGREVYWIAWDEHGVRPLVRNGRQRVRSTRLGTPLLGRFDRLAIEPAKNTARFRQFAPSMPYFRRQQIGLPFAAAVIGDKIDRAEEHFTFPTVFRNEPLTFPPAKAHQPDGDIQIPLATISILLVQRSARLSFVERLLAENLVMNSYHAGLSSPYQYFRPQSDIGLLTDGWGDIFLILFGKCDAEKRSSFREYVERCKVVGERFGEIIALRKSIFEDTLVVRSETSYTPLAIDTALLYPRQFRCTIAIRFIATRNAISLAEEFESHLYDVFHNRYGGALWKILSYSSISGRNDYVITSRQNIDEKLPIDAYELLCADCEDFNAYGIIFETLRRVLFEPKFIREHVDTTTTTIGELRFPKY